MLVNKYNIQNESYYNLLKLVYFTGYSDIINAFNELDLQYALIKDAEGNIIKIEPINLN